MKIGSVNTEEIRPEAQCGLGNNAHRSPLDMDARVTEDLAPAVTLTWGS